ncbi:hypothetical protein BpHYR1_034010 [Brachionus plicatilis]|uniref:Uncharacterized protein n=1 Tax=Brachionus plicatilis TaxID=10195 RepID=A0A3M7Q7Z3_BRAPC|nr:hypothetical protein BpHYR1_034010 [Brachionus plicatilis]
MALSHKPDLFLSHSFSLSHTNLSQSYDLRKNFYQYLLHLDQLKEFFSKYGYINRPHRSRLTVRNLEATTLLSQLNETAKQAEQMGLVVNAKKTEAPINQDQIKTLKLGNQEIEWVNNKVPWINVELFKSPKKKSKSGLLYTLGLSNAYFCDISEFSLQSTDDDDDDGRYIQIQNHQKAPVELIYENLLKENKRNKH